MQAEAMEPKPGHLSGELLCGYNDGQTLHTTYMVREMTGVEEDILAGKGDPLTKFGHVIGNCTVSIGEIIDPKEIHRIVRRLPAIDRVELLIAIRRVSISDLYRFRYQCAECGHVGTAQVDLAKLERKPVKEPGKLIHEFVTPSGRKVEWKIMDGEDEVWLRKARISKTWADDRLTLELLARVLKIDGTPVNRSSGDGIRAAISALKALSLRDRNALRREFSEGEGDIDLDIEIGCESCGHEWKTQVPLGDEGFFFPAVLDGS